MKVSRRLTQFAGREIRVMVKPEEVSDDAMKVIAREMANKIKGELNIPGR